MIKIGFIDNFLSEWHANNYPDMIRANERARSLGMDVCYAYAKEEVSPYDGVTTDEWCRAHGVRRVGSVEELVDRSDCIAALARQSRTAPRAFRIRFEKRQAHLYRQDVRAR